jgi:hypothetical protein
LGWWMKAVAAVPPTTEEAVALRASVRPQMIRSRLAKKYFEWRLERIEAGDEWRDKRYRKALEDKEKELELVIEDEMKTFSWTRWGRSIGDSEGPSEKKEE